MSDANPVVRQRQLGIRLRELRYARGLTVEDVADRLLCSATKISRMETGARRATLRDVRDLCQLYGIDNETSVELMELAREARMPGWWAQYDNPNLAPFIGLEQGATAITSFGMTFVPALLQTEDYARATLKGISPRISQDSLFQRVEIRIRRQQLLEQDGAPHYRALLDEAILHRQVGGMSVMKAQLEKILRLADEGKVEVRIIPFEIGVYTAVDSNFDFLEFGVSALPQLVFVEGLTSNLYLERDADLERYREAIEYLRDAALSPRDSAARIAGANDAFAKHHF